MGKYMVYGYLLDLNSLANEGVKMGMGTNESENERENSFHRMLFWIARQAGLNMGRSKLLHVRVMVEGEVQVWPCLAIATNDPRDGLPKSRADQLNLERLKELLHKERPPRWYPYDY